MATFQGTVDTEALQRALPARGVAAQLLGQLRAWLSRQPAGSRLPSERELSRLLSVNRLTLRKVTAELLACGELRREGRRTFVARVAGRTVLRGNSPAATAAVPPAEVVVPHAFIHAVRAPRLPLTEVGIAVYENLPWQQRCWARIVNRFNATHPALRLTVHAVPAEVDTVERYTQFLTERGADLALFPGGLLAELQGSGALAPLSPHLQAFISGPDFLWSALVRGETVPTPMVGAPLHFALTPVVINDALAGGLPLPRPLDDLGLARWLAAVAPRLKPDIVLAANVDALAVVGTTRMRTLNAADITACLWHLRELAAVLQPGGAKRFSALARHSEAVFRQFRDGHALCLLEPSFMAFNALAECTFPWSTTFLLPPPGELLTSGMTAVAVTATARQAPAAETVIEFLLSAEAQALIVAERVNCPIRRDCLGALETFLRVRPATRLAQALAQLRIPHGPDQGYWNWLLDYVVAPRLAAAVTGAAPADDAFVAGALAEARKFVGIGAPA